MTELFKGTSPETLDLLVRRRSTSAKAMGAPGPNAEQLSQILAASARVPDHGKLFPWRFIVFEGEALAEFGLVLEQALVAKRADVGEGLRRFERNRFLRAPLVIAVVSSLKTEKPIPEWEQRLSAGAVCQNMLIAAAAIGFGANWITEWYAYDETVDQALGLGEGERIAGYVYIGTGTEELAERDRPVMDNIVSHWRAVS
jgi:nitroreductase